MGFSVIILLVVALSVYVFWHLWRITPGRWPLKLTVTGLFPLWMAILFGQYFSVEWFPIRLGIVLHEVGNAWLVAFLYLYLLFLVADLASLFHLLPKKYLKNSAAGLLTAFGIVALLMAYGGINYKHKYPVEMTVTTDKPLEKPLKIVMVSDLHLGYHNRKAELGRWVDIINAQNPDLVLICGDLIDRSLQPVLKGNYGEEFLRFKAPVWAVLGNHDFYGNVVRAEQFFKESEILLLKDSVAHFKGVDVIGRNDLSSSGRASLAQLADGLEGFTLVLDHQPFHLEEAQNAGIDFQFSGHTHHGQVWPISWLTDAIYDVAYGPFKRGETQYYVTSGLGIWGPKFRIGTRSEYFILHLESSNYL